MQVRPRGLSVMAGVTLGRLARLRWLSLSIGAVLLSGSRVDMCELSSNSVSFELRTRHVRCLCGQSALSGIHVLLVPSIVSSVMTIFLSCGNVMLIWALVLMLWVTSVRVSRPVWWLTLLQSKRLLVKTIVACLGVLVVYRLTCRRIVRLSGHGRG